MTIETTAAQLEETAPTTFALLNERIGGSRRPGANRKGPIILFVCDGWVTGVRWGRCYVGHQIPDGEDEALSALASALAG